MATENPALPESFDEAYLRHSFRPSARPSNYYAWDLARVRLARDAQCRGNFRMSADLAEAQKTDPAVFAALFNRLAPQRGLPIEFECESEDVRLEAARTRPTALPSGVLSDGFERMAMLGVGVSQNLLTPRRNGHRVDFRLEPWPMQSIYWDAYACRLKAITTDGVVDVVHGDGKWVVWQLHAAQPWHWGATKALAVVWADRQFGVKDRSLNAEAHGIAKVIAELGAQYAIDSPQGKAVAELCQALGRHSRAGGVVPNGTLVKMLESQGQGWQIFRELIDGDSKDIARILLGSEGSMVGEGGNYIKAAQLFGIRNDIVEGDLTAGAAALNSGHWRPWAMLNLGSAELAPRMRYLFPDPDEDARKAELAKRWTAFHATVKAHRENGFVLDQPFVDKLAARFGVDAPKVADPRGEIFQYDLELGVVSPNEARERKGFKPREGGDEFVPDRNARLAREQQAAGGRPRSARRAGRARTGAVRRPMT